MTRSHMVWLSIVQKTPRREFADSKIDLTRVPEETVIQDLMASLPSIRRRDVPLHMWWDPNAPSPLLIPGTGNDDPGDEVSGLFDQHNQDFFVAALPNATTTGVLGQRAMRLSSTNYNKMLWQWILQNFRQFANAAIRSLRQSRGRDISMFVYVFPEIEGPLPGLNRGMCRKYTKSFSWRSAYRTA